jgi:hypothetical protein
MTNPDDMTQWDEIRCQRGCETHPTREVHVWLGGPTGYRDLPSIPRPLSTEFDLLIWDTDQTPVDGGPYCPARDAVSETIQSHGVWEPVETIVMLDCFRRSPDNVFVDIGAQIGWFSKLAQEWDMPVVAVEADPVVCGVLEHNIGLRSQDSWWNICQWRVDDDLEAFCPRPGPPMNVTAKIDVEGAEPEAVEMLFRSFPLSSIDYMMIEISPVFHDRYPAMVRRIMEAGFAAGVLPEKSLHPPPFNGVVDLAYSDNPAVFSEWVATWHQQNVLFVRKDLL